MTHPTRYGHDCETCQYLGHYEGCDLYYCAQGIYPTSLPTVIARFGSGPGYISGMQVAKAFKFSDTLLDANLPYVQASKALRVAYLIAVDLGLVVE
jgi:hypothetical protein